jgi:hypothetical protein
VRGAFNQGRRELPCARSHRRAGAALALVVATMAGCGPQLHPLPAGAKVPDLRGTWRGVWGASQLVLTLNSSDMAFGPSVLNIGGFPLDSAIAGDRELSYAGSITYEVRGDAVSTSVRGRVAFFTGRVTLVLNASPLDGDQQLVLTGVQPNRLSGNGSSTFRWGPQGQIDLLREAGPPPPPQGPAPPAR